MIWSTIIDLNPVRFSSGPHDGTKLTCGTKPMRYETPRFRDRRGATLFRYSYRAEITQFLCVNRIPIRSDAWAIRYGCVDISSNGLKLALNLKSGLNLIMVWSIMHQEELKGLTRTYCLRFLAREGGGGTAYDCLYREAPPERGIFFRLQVYEREGILLVELYRRVGKSVIWVCERAQKG